VRDRHLVVGFQPGPPEAAAQIHLSVAHLNPPAQGLRVGRGRRVGGKGRSCRRQQQSGTREPVARNAVNYVTKLSAFSLWANCTSRRVAGRRRGAPGGASCFFRGQIRVALGPWR
jgi:hypothetical protein